MFAKVRHLSHLLSAKLVEVWGKESSLTNDILDCGEVGKDKSEYSFARTWLQGKIATSTPSLFNFAILPSNAYPDAV